MKKFILACGASLMLAAAITGCSGKADNAADGTNTALGDSLAECFGALQGAQFLDYYNHLDSADRAKFSKEAMLRGLKETLFSDTTDNGYLIGQNTGMGFLSEIMQIERMSNIRIDRKKLYDVFAAAVMKDSVGNMQQLQQEMQAVSMQVRDEMQKYQRAQKLNSPEVIENTKAGKAFVEKQKKADPAIKTTESGLSYKEVIPGTGAKVGPDDKVMVNYTGKHINGEVFDSSKGEPRQMSPKAVVPGFREALLMMNKGAKYEVYIPGDLAYDVDGRPGTIAPMETLVFEIEVVDVEPAADAAVSAANNAAAAVKSAAKVLPAKK